MKELTPAQAEEMRGLLDAAKQANDAANRFFRYLVREHGVGEGWTFDEQRMVFVRAEPEGGA